MKSQKEVVAAWRQEHPYGHKCELYGSVPGISRSTVNRWWNKVGVDEKPLSASETVQKWRNEHPDGKKKDCISDTGLSRRSVFYHWDPPVLEPAALPYPDITEPALPQEIKEETINIIEDSNGQLAFDF